MHRCKKFRNILMVNDVAPLGEGANLLDKHQNCTILFCIISAFAIFGVGSLHKSCLSAGTSVSVQLCNYCQLVILVGNVSNMLARLAATPTLLAKYRPTSPCC